jgi:hypothetical protein
MANREHVARLREGIDIWNAWRRTAHLAPNLEDADLADFNLERVNLEAANLNGVNLSNVMAARANFRFATMHSVLAHGANLTLCDFTSALLDNTNLSGAKLSLVTFNTTSLIDSDMSEATVGYTVFSNLNLSNVRGLDKLHHESASSVGIDTLFRSGGLPESFLRGCGVPEEFIGYANSLIGKRIEYYSSFISYSSRDEAFARRLYEALQRKGIRTWYAPENLKIGDRIRARIDESIRVHDKLILVLSTHSVASNWVETEVEAALEREQKEKQDVLFPIAIDDEGFDSQQPWARDIRRKRHIGDFRNWKTHDEFEKAFDRLVRDLRRDALHNR